MARARAQSVAVLGVNSNKLVSLKGLDQNPSLIELEAADNFMTKIIGISKCKMLTTLDLSRNQLTDITGLRPLKKLTVRLGEEGLVGGANVGCD